MASGAASSSTAAAPAAADSQAILAHTPAAPSPADGGTDIPRPTQIARPYTGNYKGATWNAQGLLATDLRRQHRKRRYLSHIMQQHDFVAVQETHGTDGHAAAMQLPDGCTPCWSHGSRQQGGVALLIKDSFLRHFQKVHQTDWVEAVPGRLGILHLRGPQGGMAIATAYFQSGHSSEASGHTSEASRREMRNVLRRAMAASPHVLWVVAGDFNWVTKKDDRFALHTGIFSGHHDNSDELHWQTQVAGPGKLVEMSQAEFTYQSEGVRSRLDRVYTSHPTSDFFMDDFWAAAWSWPEVDEATKLPDSDHRPLSFGHAVAQPDGRPPVVKEHQVRHPDFAARVSREYHAEVARRALAGLGLDPMHRLRAVKKAIHTVTSIMEETQCGKALRTKGHCPSTAATAFRLLAAIRSGTIYSTERLRQRLPPDWAALAPQRSSLAQCTQQLQDKAIELTKAEVLQDMRDLQNTEKGEEGEAIDEQQRKTRRNAIGRRIAQLSRKTVASGIYLMLDAQGQAHSEEAQVAELLAAHWRKSSPTSPLTRRSSRRGAGRRQQPARAR